MTVTLPTAVLGGAVRPSTGSLRPLDPTEIRLTSGFWAQKQQLNGDVILGHCRTWMDRVGWIANFDRAADGTVAERRKGVEFVDSEVYKLLEAMAWELGRRPDDELEAEYDGLVSRVVAAQEPDGYLHTGFGRAGQRPRFSDLEWGHELYCFGHLFQAAVARLRTGHDDALPAAARRLADHVVAEFGPGARAGICGHPEIEMGLVELGRATGDQRYIEQARLFIERRGRRSLATTLFQDSDYFLDDVPVREAQVLRGHAVRAMYLAAGAVDVATETGDDELLAAVQRQWAGTVARRTYLTGGVGSHHQNEAFGDDFELPADRAYAETCAAIGSVMLSWRLLLATGETKYADLVERTLFNAVLVGPSEDGRSFFYANTLHQRHAGEPQPVDEVSRQAESNVRAPWFEVSCCPTNVARTLAQIGDYFATRTDAGVQLHQYGGYRIRTALPSGSPVHLDVETAYPYSGEVRVRVVADGEFELRLRIPAWAEGATLDVDAGRVDEVPGAFVVGGRFAAGDVLVLRLPTGLRTVRADPRIDAVRGALAFERGPLVLCVESTGQVDLEAAVLDEVPARSGIDEVRLRPVAVPQTGWPFGGGVPDDPGEPVTVPLRPYASWGNRGPSTMRVWIPER